MSDSGRGRPTLCLSMIVKDERAVITRCLESVRPLVDTWVIVDTGSTDGTQDAIRECLRDVPGELHQRPWRNFGWNRTEAVELGRGRADYLLVMDADDTLRIPDGFTLPALTADAYQLKVEDAGTAYHRTHLFRSDLDFRYVGVLHEWLESATPRVTARLDGPVYVRGAGGARSRDPEKYRKDAEVLEQALATEPGNARYAYYLAQSYRDAGALEPALAAYERRAAMGGWEEEVYSALHEAARLMVRLGKADDAVVAAFLRAFEARPGRAESLCELAAFLRGKGRTAAAYPFARAAAEAPRPDDILFVDESVYSWRAKDELGVAAYWAGRYEEALRVTEALLAEPHLPADHRARVEKNLEFCRGKVRR